MRGGPLWISTASRVRETSKPLQAQQVRAAAAEVSRELSSDVLFFNGEISVDNYLRLAELCGKQRKRDNVLLILVTPGGDPHAAFRMGRLLQHEYASFSLYITGYCKSAGTLVALAANQLYMGIDGELGPLDVQVPKTDEMEMSSVLAPEAALRLLEEAASRIFFRMMMSLRRETEGMMSTKTAAELASATVSQLLEPLYRQIDPIRIGEISQAKKITRLYGDRLNATGKNLRDDKSLEFLISAYPDHGCVIDKTEASGLFRTIVNPTDSMIRLAQALGRLGLLPQSRAGHDDDASIEFLSGDGPGVRRGVERNEEAGRAPRPGTDRPGGRGKADRRNPGKA